MDTLFFTLNRYEAIQSIELIEVLEMFTVVLCKIILFEYKMKGRIIFDEGGREIHRLCIRLQKHSTVHSSAAFLIAHATFTLPHNFT